MRKELIIEISYKQLIQARVHDSKILFERFRYLIDNNVVLHNDQLNIDYVVREIGCTEVWEKACIKLKVIIDILDGIDKDIQHQLKQLRMSLGELLPTKPPQKFAGE